MPFLLEKYSHLTMGFAAHRYAMLKTIAANKGKALKATPYADGPAHGVDTTTYGAYTGGCRIPGSKVLMAPHGAPAFGLYDGVANTFSLVSPHGLSGGGRFRGAVLGNDELSFVIPGLAANVWIFDNASMTAVAGPAHGRSGVAFGCGAKTLDGDGDEIIVLGPSAGTKLGIIRVRTQVLEDGPDVATGMYFAQTMPDGRVFLGGLTTGTTGQIYDPVTKVVSTVVSDGALITSRSATLRPDNSLAVDGASGSRPRLFKGKWGDTSELSSVDGPSYSSTGASYRYGIKPLPNDTLCIAPGSADRVAFWNREFPQSLTYSDQVSETGGLLFSGQLMLPNGKNVLIPSRHPNVGLVDYIDGVTGFPEAVCCSAFYGSAL